MAHQTEDSANSKTSQEDDIGLVDLFRILWINKWIISWVTGAAALVSVVVALLLPNIYRAEALLAPNLRNESQGLSALAAQYGGLASLAGIDLGSGTSDNVALGVEILRSRKFIMDFLSRHEVLVPLIAATGWNSESGELEISGKDYDVEAQQWIRKPRGTKSTIPSLQEGYEEFGDIFSVSHDKSTGFVTVSIEHYSPAVAKQWVDWLVKDLNREIMARDVGEAEAAIAYLELKIATTPLADLKSVFFRLIEEHTKTILLAEISDEYFLKTIDPAVEPEKKAKPKRAVIVLLSVMAGFFMSASYAFLSASMRRPKTAS